jgi:AraC-like DNA-binding protein
MKHIPLVRANIIKKFVAFLEEMNVPTRRLLAEAKLPVSALHNPEALLPLKQVFEFYERSARAGGCEHLGLLVGQQIQLDDLGAFGRLLRRSLTLYDAIHIGIYMSTTYNSGERFWLTEQGDQMWLCHSFIEGIKVGRQQADHCSAMIMINWLRLAAGSQWRPQEVHLETGWIRGLNDIEPLSDATILFDQNATAIAFPRSLLSLPLEHIGEDRNIQRYQDYTILYSSAPATSFSGAIRQIVGVLLREGYPDIRLIAEIVGMSVRSFQRYLNETNLTYSHLIDQVRYEQSVQLLSDPTIKLTDIAAALGYRDAANFTRAFRRWTRTSPSEFRYLRWKI